MAQTVPQTAEDLRADLEKQIAEMKREMTKLKRSVALRASDLIEDASDAADNAYAEGRGHAHQLVRQMRHQAHVAVDTARENPVTTATVLSTVALIALATGVVIGGAISGTGRR